MKEDKYAARASGGLDDNSNAFNVLPPHFEGPVKITNEDLIPVSIMGKASPNLSVIFTFGIATALYHWDWLKANLPSDHPFIISAINSSNHRNRYKVKEVNEYIKDKRS